jgi:hypothetical protein
MTIHNFMIINNTIIIPSTHKSMHDSNKSTTANSKMCTVSGHWLVDVPRLLANLLISLTFVICQVFLYMSQQHYHGKLVRPCN